MTQISQIHFTSPEHKARLLGALRDHRKVDSDRVDPEYAAAYSILLSDLFWPWCEGSYITQDGILFDDMPLGTMSSGEVVLLQLAANLFNPLNSPCAPVDLMSLDLAWFQIAISALWLRRGTVSVTDIELCDAYTPTPGQEMAAAIAGMKARGWRTFEGGQ